jgi:hypothetical protein
MAKWGLAYVEIVVYGKNAFGLPSGRNWAVYHIFGDDKGRREFDAGQVDLCIASLLKEGWEPLGFHQEDLPNATWTTTRWTFKKEIE